MEFTLRTKITATPKEIYTTWLSSEGHALMTGGSARISDKIGDKFTAWDGYIEGCNVELKPYTRIYQSWRTSQFEENEPDSHIEILLQAENQHTELTLIHTDLPESGGHYEKGWNEHYFEPMKAHFSNKR